MPEANGIVEEIRAALEKEPHVNPHDSTIEIYTPGDKVVLDGEVSDIAEKRRIVECAKRVAPGKDAVDHICVKPAERIPDGAIRDFLATHLLEEPVFLRSVIVCQVAGDGDAVLREPNEPDGRIQAAIAEGVITLTGEVLSLSHRRLAEVLAWWTHGCRNVINELNVTPAERDNDGELSDALELVLNKDPIVPANQLTTQVHNGRVTIRGLAASEEEKRMIERDLWYVEGVRDVANEIEVYLSLPERQPNPGNRPAG